MFVICCLIRGGKTGSGGDSHLTRLGSSIASSLTKFVTSWFNRRHRNPIWSSTRSNTTRNHLSGFVLVRDSISVVFPKGRSFPFLSSPHHSADILISGRISGKSSQLCSAFYVALRPPHSAVGHISSNDWCISLRSCVEEAEIKLWLVVTAVAAEHLGARNGS